jgi:hypothetical protein
LILLAVAPTPARAAGGQEAAPSGLEARVADLETRLEALAREVDSLPVGLILILFGGFCALWAQNTGRSAWAWFFLGLLFNVFALIALLSKNAREARLEDAAGG